MFRENPDAQGSRTPYGDRIKTGIRGTGYVKIDDSAVWPDRLQNLVTPPREAHLTK